MVRTSRIVVLPALALAMALCSACTRQVNSRTPGPGTPADDTQVLPFNQTGRKEGGSIVAALRDLPAGTTVTVRLQNRLSSAAAQSGDTFEALIDEPIVVEGQTLMAKGFKANGRVVAAKASSRLEDPGYIRLTLTSIETDGNLIPLQTSSIVAKGGSPANRERAANGGGGTPGALVQGVAGGGKGELVGTTTGPAGTAYVTRSDVEFSPERRLTFRLTQAASLPN